MPAKVLAWFLVVPTSLIAAFFGLAASDETAIAAVLTVVALQTILAVAFCKGDDSARVLLGTEYALLIAFFTLWLASPLLFDSDSHGEAIWRASLALAIPLLAVSVLGCIQMFCARLRKAGQGGQIPQMGERATAQFLDVNDMRLRVAEAGSGEPLVLAHGWGASHRIWDRAVAELAKRRRVIRFDWPGHGESDRSEAPYEVPWFAGVLGKVLDALGLGSAEIAGHSMGGAIAAAFALEHPERVRKLVLVNALVHGPSAYPFRTKLLTLCGMRRLAYWMLGARWFRRWVAKDFTWAERLSDDLVDDLSRGTFASLIRSIVSMRRTVLPLDRLRVPTLVIGTDHDQVLLPSQFEAQRAVPGAVVRMIDGSGHCPNWERPVEFCRVVMEFLD